MIRSSILLLILIFCQSVASAQTRKGFHLGVSAIVTAPLGKEVDIAGLDEEKLTDQLSYGGRAEIGYMLTDNLGLFTGFTFLMRPKLGEEKPIFAMLIPVYLNYVTGKPGNIGFYAQVGVQTGIRRGVVTSEETLTVGTGYEQSFSFRSNFGYTSITALCNFGVEIPILPRLALKTGASVDLQVKGAPDLNSSSCGIYSGLNFRL